MKSLRLTASLAAAILTAAILTPAARAQERIEVPWAELGPALAGHIVSTVLPDGTALRGHVLDVSAEQLRFEANKTSNGALYPKGELSLARNQLKVFSYTQKRGRAPSGRQLALPQPLRPFMYLGSQVDKRTITVIIAQD